MHMVEFWGWESTLSTQSPERTQKFGIFRGVLEIYKKQKTPKTLGLRGFKVKTISNFAERKGFEPSIHFWRIHTFQACSFNHSDTSLNGVQIYELLRSFPPKIPVPGTRHLVPGT